MSTLGCFCFGTDELNEDVLGLFSYLVEHPEHRCDCVSEIVDSALSGKINMDREFNMLAFEKQVHMNNFLYAEREKNKFDSLDEPIPMFDKDATLGDTIPEPTDRFASMHEDMNYDYAVAYIKDVSGDIIIEHNVDICSVLYSALNCVTPAVETLKFFCNMYNKLKECIETVLTHGVDESFLKYLEGGTDYGYHKSSFGGSSLFSR